MLIGIFQVLMGTLRGQLDYFDRHTRHELYLPKR